ncbi:MAG: hypothetical protein QXL94_08640, partial [Candidatus Parvarchaeum sp.]
LIELQWFFGEKGEPIPAVGALDNYRDKIDYEVYWEKAIRKPINRILKSVGFVELVKEKKPRKNKKKNLITNLF